MTVTETASARVPGANPDRLAHDIESLKVIPQRSYRTWAVTAVVTVLVAMVIHSLATNTKWEWHVVSQYLTWPSVLVGLRGTILLTVVSAVIGFGLGTVLALMRLSKSPLLQAVSWGYTWVFRSVPLILQLLLWYNLAYLYPTLTIGIPFGPSFYEFGTLDVINKFGAAILGLGLSQAAYSAEIVRAGILGVDQGQQEAAAALGIPAARQNYRIILPQAMRTIVPTSMNEIIGLVKGTSVVYVLAYNELFYTVGVIYGRNQRVIPLLMVAAIWYLIITTAITVVQYYVERHYAKGAVRTLPPTPLQSLRWTTSLAISRLTCRVTDPNIPISFVARSTANRNHLLRGTNSPKN